MDLLIIGLDGGDEQILRAMNTPKITSILEDNKNHNISEDLWNRGWVSVLSGHHGQNTGAFYEKPKLDGSHQFTQSFGTSGYEKNNLITPLWDTITNAGHSIGFMNLPTTVPAPTVDGFFISGAGGGYDPAGGVPKDACYPSDVWRTLQDNDYLWETRFGASGIRDKNDFVDTIKTTLTRRHKLYLQLCDQFEPDIGFIVHKELVSIQNLAMSEIKEMMNSGGNPNNQFQENIKDIYSILDDIIADLLAQLDPNYVLIVSDHGSRAYRKSINVNAYLQKIDLQQPEKVSTAKSRNLARNTAERLPKEIRSVLKQLVPSVAQTVMKRNVDWDKTEAFGARYVPGIYLNDSRFEGPVSNKEKSQLVEKIIEDFNNTTVAAEHNLSARPYREQYTDAKFNDLLPDIWIDSPDTVFFTETGDFVELNEAYGPIDSVRNVDRDLYTGIKGSKPILCADQAISDLATSDDPDDLRLAYNLIKRFVEQ